MKLSVSLPDDDVEFLDGFALAHGHSSRSAAVHEAVRLLRANEIGSDYAQAWQEFEASGDADVWAVAAGDAVAD